MKGAAAEIQNPQLLLFFVSFFLAVFVPLSFFKMRNDDSSLTHQIVS